MKTCKCQAPSTYATGKLWSTGRVLACTYCHERVRSACLVTLAHHGPLGAAQPIFSWLLGQFTDAIGEQSTDQFVSQVNNLALYFVYTAIGSMAMAFLQVGASGCKTLHLRVLLCGMVPFATVDGV
eukprot:365509-Chlamydomonas_euryale.AAC.15